MESLRSLLNTIDHVCYVKRYKKKFQIQNRAFHINIEVLTIIKMIEK